MANALPTAMQDAFIKTFFYAPVQTTSSSRLCSMNYVEFTATTARSIALKKYLQDQKILPGNAQVYTHVMTQHV